MAVGSLTFFCGKMGAGKSTQSKKLARAQNAVLISEDDWLANLYPDQINTLEDYVEYSGRLKPLLQEHIGNLLRTGTHVVMDFPGNTPKQRAWFKQLCDASDIEGRLIYLKISDEKCLEQLAIRREEQPERNQFDTEEMFRKVSSFFSEPQTSEGFKLEVVEDGIIKDV